jgi:hypothetical protein
MKAIVQTRRYLSSIVDTIYDKENSLTDGSITSFKNETDSLIDTIGIDPLLIVPSYGGK